MLKIAWVLGPLIWLMSWPSAVHSRPAEAGARFLHQPTVRGAALAFIADGEIWTVGVGGGRAARLTTDSFPKSEPRFSPDGSQIAYTATAHGNRDVYVVSARGGAPRRLTWHPADDDIRGWSPDGRFLIVASRRRHPFRQPELFRLPAAGGVAAVLPVGQGDEAALDPSGRYLAFTPNQSGPETWKRYRGGRASIVRVVRLSDWSHKDVPHHGANDSGPLWIADVLYLRSDRAGSFGLYAWRGDTGEIRPVVSSDRYDVDSFSGDGDLLIFASSGYLHQHRISTGRTRRLTISLPGARSPERRLVDAEPLVQSMALAPDARSLAIEARGEIFLQVDGRAPVNLSRTTGVAERAPVWSPDGRSIAYISDETGNYEIMVRPAMQAGIARRLGTAAGFPSRLTWSPDSRTIAYLSPTQSAWQVNVKTGRHRRFPGQVLAGSPIEWLPNSSGFYFIEHLPSGFGQARLADVATGRVRAVTDEFGHVRDLQLAADGSLVLLASLDAGPVVTEYDASAMLFESGVRSAIYRVPAAKDSAGSPAADPSSSRPSPVVADWRPLPSSAGIYTAIRRSYPTKAGGTLLTSTAGEFATIRRNGPPEPYFDWYSADPGTARSEKQWTLASFDSGGNPRREAAALMQGFGDAPPTLGQILSASTLQTSAARGHHLLNFSGRPVVLSIDSKGAAQLRALQLRPLTMRVDEAAEWRQIFQETWRSFRDFFHDPRMHGVDWQGKGELYRSWLRDVRSRSDVDFILRHLVGELGNSHIRVVPPSPTAAAAEEMTGFLGADFEPRDGRLVLTRVLAGTAWDAVSSPLADTGVEAGDALVAIEGVRLAAGDDPHRLLVGRANRPTSVTFKSSTSGIETSHMVTPLGSERWLRRRAWIEDRRRHVDQRSAGRIAYIQQPDTSQGGLAEFIRYFFPQAKREALIIDERFNAGGADSDYQLDALGRTRFHWYGVRDLRPMEAPTSALAGPKVMLVNAEAASGGDVFPYQFKTRGLGRVIGTRTFGGVNGGYRGGQPAMLIDGGRVPVPDLATFSPNGEAILENVGFEPDETVDITPADHAAGRDPQLDRAIDYLLGMLPPSRPPAVTLQRSAPPH